MGDVTPDYVYERKRLENERLQVSVNVTDQRIQLLDLATEREAIEATVAELEAEMPDLLADGAERELLQNQLEREKAQLGIGRVSLRIVEIDGIESRLRENIDAAEKALAELDARIEEMKETHGG